MTLDERLDAGEIIILDGAMGTELERRGVPMDGVAWSAAAMLTHPETVRAAHEDYIRAGADVIIANTFGTSRHVLEPAGLGEEVRTLNLRAVELAQAARDRAAGGREVLIAGSISSFVAGADREQAPPLEEAAASYREQADLLVGAGVDLIALEMMRDVDLSLCATEAAATTGLPTWVGFTCRRGDDASTVLLNGRDEAEPFADALPRFMEFGGSVMGVMHSEVEDTVPALDVVFENWSGPVAAYPHSGGFVMPNWQFDDIISPANFVAEAQKWVEMGVQIVGGCCGIGPDHIRLLKERLPSRVVRRS